MKTAHVSLIGLILLLSSCSDKPNPLVPISSLYSFSQKWGKDYSNPDNSIGPGYGDGTSGSETGAYNNPTRVALSGGCLLVLDAGNHRIQKFGLNGSISSFAFQKSPDVVANSLGTEGAIRYRFSKPSDLKTDPSGNIFVPDANNFNVQIFSPAGTNLQMLAVTNAGLPKGTNAPGGFMKPVAVCADNSGGLYVLDPVKNTVDKFTNSAVGKWIISAGWGTSGSLSSSLFHRGVAMDFDSTRLLVLLPEGFISIDILSQTVTTKSIFGYSLNRLSSATGIKVSSDRIFVTEGSMIKVFNKTFNLVTTIGGISGNGDGEFLSPSDALPAGTTLYVADSGNNRLQLFKSR
jgi:hypothetical protein